MVISSLQAGFVATVYLFIFLLGSFANGLIILTYIKFRSTLICHPKDVLVLSLAIGDLMISFFFCPMGLTSGIAKKWLWGSFGCTLYAFMTTWIGLASITQLMILAIERNITLSSATPNILSKRKTLLAALVSWLFSFLSSCLPLIGWSKYTYEGFGLHCSIPWDVRTLTNVTYCIFLLVVFFCVPFFFIFVSYVKIFITVKRICREASNIWGAEAKATKQSYYAQVKTTKQVLMMIMGFLFAWTPYALMSALVVIFHIHISFAAMEYPSMFAKTAVISNPIIYFFCYRRFRRQAIKALKCAGISLHPIVSSMTV